MLKKTVLFLLLLTLFTSSAYAYELSAEPSSQSSKANAVSQTSDSYIKTISKSQVQNAYKKYVLPYLDPDQSVGALTYKTSDLYGSKNHLTDKGYQATLGAVNFLREIYGVAPVALSDELNRLSQAGVDYLYNNDLWISHDAANDSDDMDAKIGLSDSNLHGGSDTVLAPYHFVSDYNNSKNYGIGHRTSLLKYSLKNIGIGSIPYASAIYVCDESAYQTQGYAPQVYSYPNAGYSPIEIITESTGGVPMWTVDISTLGKVDESKFKLTISEENGKTVTFHHDENPDPKGTWYKFAQAITINPYVFTDNGDYSSLKNRTFTITLDGLNCPDIGVDKISFKTTFFSMKDAGFNPYIKEETEETPEVESNNGSVYRLYNKVSHEHLYTTSSNEATTLDKTVDWVLEGVAWNAPSSGDGVYRLYSPITKAHLYTKDKNEVNTLSQTSAWSVDNDGKPLFYSGGSKPIYRLYNEGTRMHLLTTDANEYNSLASSGWNAEGVALNCN